VEDFIKVASLGDLQPGEMKLLNAFNPPRLLVNVEGGYYVVDEVCPHADAPLSEGILEQSMVECPWHGSQFDVTTGEVLTGPAMENLCRYDVRILGDDILVGPVKSWNG
jgi:nitrite reductase/ring-hydroxylating ferredoxin subunit